MSMESPMQRLDTKFNSGYVTSQAVYIDVNTDDAMGMDIPEDTKTERAAGPTPDRISTNRRSHKLQELDKNSSKKKNTSRKQEKFLNILDICVEGEPGNDHEEG